MLLSDRARIRSIVLEGIAAVIISSAFVILAVKARMRFNMPGSNPRLAGVVALLAVVGVAGTWFRIWRWRRYRERLREVYRKAREEAMGLASLPDSERERRLEEAGEQLGEEVKATAWSLRGSGVLSTLSERELVKPGVAGHGPPARLQSPLRDGLAHSVLAVTISCAVGAAIALGQGRVTGTAWRVGGGLSVLSVVRCFGYAYVAGRLGLRAARVFWGVVLAGLALLGVLMLKRVILGA
jgi:hypothetical protein